MPLQVFLQYHSAEQLVLVQPFAGNDFSVGVSGMGASTAATMVSLLSRATLKGGMWEVAQQLVALGCVRGSVEELVDSADRGLVGQQCQPVIVPRRSNGSLVVVSMADRADPGVWQLAASTVAAVPRLQEAVALPNLSSSECEDILTGDCLSLCCGAACSHARKLAGALPLHFAYASAVAATPAAAGKMNPATRVLYPASEALRRNVEDAVQRVLRLDSSGALVPLDAAMERWEREVEQLRSQGLVYAGKVTREMLRVGNMPLRQQSVLRRIFEEALSSEGVLDGVRGGVGGQERGCGGQQRRGACAFHTCCYCCVCCCMFCCMCRGRFALLRHGGLRCACRAGRCFQLVSGPFRDRAWRRDGGQV